jgi:hypothetical protein
MKVSLHVAVAMVLILGMGLFAQLNAQAMSTTRYGPIAQQSGTSLTGAVTQPSSAAAPKADAPAGNASTSFSQAGPPADVMNRKALEQRAGKDAAKLVLRSVPGEALIYIDGMYVGRTPLLLIVPPGKYKLEMHGQRDGFGERSVGLLPNETQQVALTLAMRYPARISVR